MNVFVLTTGRSGSTTFYEACKHIENYTCGHESRASLSGEERLNYPDNHIEIDNRLSWFLGRLDEKYGNKAIYVHLKRDEKAVAESYYKRREFPVGIMRAYFLNILMKYKCTFEDAVDLTNTVNSNINLFLKDKNQVQILHLESIQDDMPSFLSLINAKCKKEDVLKSFDSIHNKKRSVSLRFRLAFIANATKQFFDSLLFILRFKG